jgi:hypothetical protein
MQPCGVFPFLGDWLEWKLKQIQRVIRFWRPGAYLPIVHISLHRSSTIHAVCSAMWRATMLTSHSPVALPSRIYPIFYG